MEAKYYILYNPHAGNGGSGEAAKKLDLNKAAIVSMTDISSYSDFFADKKDMPIVICGGDGTLNRFINEVDGVPHGDIYYIASGSGNDFLRDLDISEQKEIHLIFIESQ